MVLEAAWYVCEQFVAVVAVSTAAVIACGVPMSFGCTFSEAEMAPLPSTHKRQK